MTLKVFEILKKMFYRSFFLYLIAFAVLAGLVDMGKVRAKTLDYLYEPIDYLIQQSESDAPVDQARIEKYINYYQVMIDYLPKSAGAYEILGYCYYQLGKITTAEYYLKKAHEIVPEYFWGLYNLAVLRYQAGEYDKALELLFKAMDSNLESNLYYITKEPAFQYSNLARLINPALLNQQISENLNNGYLNAYKMVVSSYLKQKAYAEVLKNSLIGINLQGSDKKFFYYHAGLAAYHLALYEDAFKSLSFCLRIDPVNLKANKLMADLLSQIGQDKQAEHFLNKAASLEASGAGTQKDKEYRLKIF